MAKALQGCNGNGDTNPYLSLLQNFITGTKFPSKFVETTSEEDEEGGLELSLGLSLKGRFGVDPASDTKLARSSSIPEFFKPSTDEGTSVSVPWMPILRTSSLPMEPHDVCRKRKQMQSLRRMEAKRKRTEKQRKVRDHRPKTGKNDLHAICRLMSGVKGAELTVDNDNVLAGSQGSGSSGISEFDPEMAEKPRPDTERKLPTNTTSLPNQPNVLLDMPCVFTKGDGPNGKRIEGFLYRYRKGVEVKIVCVCHGSFLSPAEFVKHAGGGDVAQPLKHIVVSPYPFL